MGKSIYFVRKFVHSVQKFGHSIGRSVHFFDTVFCPLLICMLDPENSIKKNHIFFIGGPWEHPDYCGLTQSEVRMLKVLF